MDFVWKLYGNTYAVHVTVALVGVATLNLALPAPPAETVTPLPPPPFFFFFFFFFAEIWQLTVCGKPNTTDFLRKRCSPCLEIPGSFVQGNHGNSTLWPMEKNTQLCYLYDVIDAHWRKCSGNEFHGREAVTYILSIHLKNLHFWDDSTR